MNSMTYKGLTACIEFDERDGIFVSRVLGRRFDSADAGVLQAESLHQTVATRPLSCVSCRSNPSMAQY